MRKARLLASGIQVVAGSGRLGHAALVGPRAMLPAAPPRVALAAAFVTAGAAVDLRLWTGDERGQPVDAAASVGDDGLGLRLRLILRLRTMLALTMFARLLLIALEGLLVVARLLALAAVAQIRLGLLHRNEARLLAEVREAFAVVLAVL